MNDSFLSTTMAALFESFDLIDAVGDMDSDTADDDDDDELQQYDDDEEEP